MSPFPETLKNQIIQTSFEKGMESIPSESVDLIITDPPWFKKYNYVWEPLAKEASRILKPGGSLVTQLGQSQLDVAMQELTKQLDYRWLGCITVANPWRHTNYIGIGVRSSFRPFLWFTKGSIGQRKKLLKDALHPTSKEWSQSKKHHDWGQPEMVSEEIISKLMLNNPNGIVVDPFCGGGTNLKVCKELGLTFTGFELSEKFCEISKNRVS